MINKLNKAICVVIAVVMCASVFLFAACEPIEQQHIHKYSSDWSMDEQYHWKAPLCDDTDVLAAYGMHNTSGDNGACSVCGYKEQVITPPPPEHEHTFASFYSTNATSHWHSATCGHSDLKQDEGEHDTNGQNGVCSVCGYKATVTPPEHVCAHVCETCGKCADANCDNSVCANKCQGHDEPNPDEHVCAHVCDICGKCADANCADSACANKCQGHAPAHQHTLSGWQYDDAAGHYKVCTGANCTEPAGTKLEQAAHDTANGDCVCGYHSHTFSTEWSNDETNHWHAATCGHSAEKSGLAAHNTSGQNGACSVCGYKEQSVIPPISDPRVLAYRGYNESLYVTWQENNPIQAKVYYKQVNSDNWTAVDAPLIRATESNVARADAVGLAAGDYNVKVVTSSNYEIVLQNPVTVTAYDRSGYAHFNYTQGVGAYKDSGELKSGALVIYLTEQNKNNVLDYAYLNGVKTDISKYMKGSDGTQYTGIGEILNNRRYGGDDRANVGIAKLCDVYGSVAVRILGKVTADMNADGTSTIIGLTDYNSLGNGGSEGDDGRMARMCNAKNLTIEGIGEDACIFGWGVHFIASEINYKSGRGQSFEVRNITFQNYPEDAIGMEGEQKEKKVTSELTFPVERCWVHNNVFLPGYCATPAESDKKEGDGSCDFKRGRYFTLSYNYFEDCHKTNLIGSASTSLQYCITMHHNWWNNCGSRIPLVRNSNVHFYNNYVYGDMSANPKPSLSYVHSVRANAYIFSEANYYDGCKNIVLFSEGGGAVKAYNNQYHSCFEDDLSTFVTSRTQAVANSCKYTFGNVDYSSFDTNATLFYYNAQTQTSDCLLDDAVTARVKVMRNAGVNGFGKTETNMLKVIPSTPVQLNEQGDTVIELKSGSATVNGVVFTDGASLSKGVLKIRGQGIVFTLQSKATLTVTTDSTDDNAPDLLRVDGAVIAGKFTGTLTVTLEAGTYCITSGMKEKETIITALSFASVVS